MVLFSLKKKILALVQHRFLWFQLWTATIVIFILCKCYVPRVSDLRLGDLRQPRCSSDLNKDNAPHGVKVIPHDFFSEKNHDLRTDRDHGDLLHNFQCVDMTAIGTSHHINICIYDPLMDKQVSYYLKHTQKWEEKNVGKMLKALEMNPGMALVDLGSNLGVFTLNAAFRGREVIALDALLPNNYLLQRSLKHNNLTCGVTILHNALHSHRHQMRIAIKTMNIGGSKIKEIPEKKGESSTKNLVDAVCLDDLVPLVRGKDVFVKMDLEGSEESVLQCAHEFFNKVNVKVLMMEWVFHRKNAAASRNIINILTSHNMVPTLDVEGGSILNISTSHWPNDIFWLKTNKSV